MDHDRLFKELLTTFFADFIDLFLPKVSEFLDRDSIEFLDKEVFSDVTSGDRHEADLVVKAKFKGRDTHFLIHVETQSSAAHDFPKRMFRYFARLHEKHDLPVYPIALFSYETPLRAEPDVYSVSFPDRMVLSFGYAVIQLNRLDWRTYARTGNPIASALMARMQIRPEDRPRVKFECFRLLATLKLNPAKMQLIRGFVDAYLKLNAAEQNELQREVVTMNTTDKEPVAEVLNYWVAEGMLKGMAELIVGQLRHRFGPIPESVQEELQRLALPQMQELGESILDFTSVDQVRQWIAGH